MHTQSVSCLPKPPPSAPASYWWRFDLQLRCELLLSCERIGSQDLQTGGPLVVPLFFCCCCAKWNHVVNFKNLQFSNCVTFVLFSLSLSLFSLSFFLPESDFPLSWHGLKSLHRTAIIFLLDEHHLWLDKTNKQTKTSSCHLNPVSWPITRL